MGPTIVISESAGFSPEAMDLLRSAGSVVAADLDRSGLYSAASYADVLWIRLRHRIDEALLAKAGRLKVVVSPTTGWNHVDVDALGRRGIHLLSLRGETEFLKDVRATAEHTVALMLTVLRHIPRAVAEVRAGRWNRDAFRGSELYGKTVGIAGYGRLGRIVARYLRAFEAHVLVTDPKLPAGEIADDIRAVEIDELLHRSDIVSIHSDLRADNIGWFSAQMFEKMKWGSCFINTARGELIDETALLHSLETGQVVAAGLDVLSNEDSDGMAQHPLVQYAKQHDNVIITPHLGGCTTESLHKTEKFLAEKLCRLLSEQGFQKELKAAG